jgi:hypothetical protein
MIKSHKPDDFAAWKKVDRQSDSEALVKSQKITDLYKPNITYKKIDGVNVVDIKPKNWSNNGKILVTCKAVVIPNLPIQQLVMPFWFKTLPASG